MKLSMAFTLLIVFFLFLGGCAELNHSVQTDDFNFRSQEQLELHYIKHVIEQQEFGDMTQDQYLQGARDLVNASSDPSVLTKSRSNGDILFYKKETNEFAVLTKQDVIRTYFKPRDGIHYFNRQ